MRDGPTPHLSWDELACHDPDRTPYPEEWRASRAPKLGAVFELLRAACGDRAIRVLSGYRTAAHNIAIGGATASQHVQGRALDLEPPEGVSLDAFADHARRLARTTPIRGIGVYPREGGGWLHVDTRPGSVLREWTG